MTKNNRPSPIEPEDDEFAETDLSFLPEFLGYNIGRAQANLRRDYLDHLGKDTLRLGQLTLLAVIAANPGWSQIRLGRMLGVDKATVVALFDHMENAGFIKREKSTTDRRKHAAYATPEGIAELARLREKAYEHERKFRERYTPEELKTLISLLQRLSDA